MNKTKVFTRLYKDLTSDDIVIVGGKNASLGEMIRHLKKKGINVPEGFATTSAAYWYFIEENELKGKISHELERLKSGKINLAKTGSNIRQIIIEAELPQELKAQVKKSYKELSKIYKSGNVDVAVRSSATAEDLPKASFAGQLESFLNISGEKELLSAVQKCYASLFTDRAIAYREEKGFDHMKVALSVGVQKMVRSDKACSGVMFTIDTETGFPDVIVINGAWGLGENVVKGVVNPDEYRVFKPLLNKDHFIPVIQRNLGTKAHKMIYKTKGKNKTENIKTTDKERVSFVLNEQEIILLSRWAVAIEKHYKRPMDIEWAKDGRTDDMYIVQARPETVESQKEASSFSSYKLNDKKDSILSGLAIGDAIAAGKACVIKKAEDIDQFRTNSILVTDMTDPDWVPIMKKASGIVTNHGGRTSHAAIVSRELGIPAIVGTGEATKKIKDKQNITISCSEGDKGYIYDGILDYEVDQINLDEIPETSTQIMMNIASPDAAFRWWRLPASGVGLARMEFIINNIIKIHPLALARFNKLKNKTVKKVIEEITKGYKDKTDYFVDRLSMGIARIASSQYPNPVIVRLSDFKTNEYAKLVGGEEFEPKEENPMIGFRGASRYYNDLYKDGFALECRAIKKVREVIGLENVIVMIPFCRTPEEGDRVLSVMAQNGLKRGENGLEIYVMIEIPSNVILADKFAERFDGFSIGSNDLTQLTLGVDRDSDLLADLFDERNEAILRSIKDLIMKAHQYDTKVGICGQAPSDYPEFAEFLVEAGIDSISLNPDSVIQVKQRISKVERPKVA
ncbi:MAG TPA: phosphoenolpyruvate synthase [Balneolales bacterium]|nr:phosphoenolpyruvate synthase [Balneolales bacterium]